MGDKRNIVRMAALALVASAWFLVAAPARAGTDDDLRGWLWSDNIGWVSMNCVTAGTCGMVNYGVDITAANDIVGYGWSANLGWMCFGETCGGITPEGVPAYANIDPAGNDAHGWANVITLGAGGWVSLNCDDINPGCADYAVNINRSTGVVSGWAWNANAGGGGGLGWFDFSWASIIQVETVCYDGLDNDSDGLIDCADPDCLGQVGQLPDILCAVEQGPTYCTDSFDNDSDGLVDCSDQTSCWQMVGSGCPAAEVPLITCGNGIDDDFDNGFGGYDNNPLTGIDCQDTDCRGDPSCPTTETVCDDNVDNDLDSLLDCADPDCDPICTGKCERHEEVKCITDIQCPLDEFGQNCMETIFPWIKTFFQDIYSTGEIRSSHPPPTGQVNATYCLFSVAGGVINFRSDPTGGCETPPPAEPVALPRASSRYTNILGRLDVAGIRAGTYGPVIPINNLSEVPSILGGKIYLYEGGGTLTTSAPVVWGNGVGNLSGAGTIIIVGNLRLAHDQNYEALPVSNFSNLASVGWLVFDDGTGTKGLIDIDPAVTSLTGVFYAEGGVSTGAGTQTLRLSGAMISREFNLERTTANPAVGSEEIKYDGRAGINPPPGLSDIAKGLPEIRSTAP